MNPEEVRTRSFKELLEAERGFRLQAEERLRGFSAVMTELAYRLAGEKLERMRKQDANLPLAWTPEQWRAFFQALTLDPDAQSGWASQPKDNGHRTALERLQLEVRRLQTELDMARQRIAELEHAASTTSSASLSPAATPLSQADLGYGYAHIPLWAWSPPLIPASYADRLRSSTATRRDAQINQRRKLLTLWLLSQSGIATQIEISRQIAVREGISPEAGSIKRPIEALAANNLLISQTLTLHLGSTPTRLVVLRLSQEGKDLCHLWGYPNVENDWERLIRLHEGERQAGHTLAVLLFAAHARLRGWRASVLPDVERLPARPDVYLQNEQGVSWYVEVETGTREHAGNAKWRNLAELQNGSVALCARTIEERKVLVGDCQQWQGVATDLESLVSQKLKHVKPGEELWVQRW